jgi:purine catabolism regulator
MAFSNLLQEDSDYQTAIDKLSEYLRLPVLLSDTMSATVWTSTSAGIFPEYSRDDIRLLREQYFSIPIADKKYTYGHIIVRTEPGLIAGSEMFMFILRHAVNILRFVFNRRVTNQKVEKRYSDPFLNDLLLEKKSICREDILHIYRLHNLLPDAPTTVLVIKPTAMGKAETEKQTYSLALAGIHTMAHRRYPHCGVSHLGEHIVLLVQDKTAGEPLSKLALQITQFLSEKHVLACKAGIGITVCEPTLYRLSYLKAIKAIEVGRYFSTGPVYQYDELEVSDFLYSASSFAEAEHLINTTLGVLLEHDRSNPSRELLGTLIAIVKNGFNLKNTSHELRIHYNTLKYRYTRICELLCLDLSTFQNRLRVFIALMMLKIRKTD